MADLVDDAQNREQQLRDEAVARIRRSVAPVAATLEPRDCIGCGDPIPAARIETLPSAKRCTGCQAKHEGRRV